MRSKSLRKPQTHSIRIIAGEWRGRRLQVLDKEGLRPTTDRVRETLFNWLMPEISGARCLDLFAGTGALGLECLSRGAAYVQFCEVDRSAAALLNQNVALLLDSAGNSESSSAARADVRSMNALDYMRKYTGVPFDLIFLDPPFSSAGLLNDALAIIHSKMLISEGGLVYVEQNRNEDPFSNLSEAEVDEGGQAKPLSSHFVEHRSQVAGKARFGLYIYRGNGV